MIYPHVISLEYLRPEDIATNARVMYDMGHAIEDCPYPQGSKQEACWRKHFIACELHEGEAE